MSSPKTTTQPGGDHDDSHGVTDGESGQIDRLDADEAGGQEAAQRSLGSALKPFLQSDRAMFGVVVAVALYWVFVLGRLIVLRQNRFGTFDFDTGIYDQFLWQVSHFRGFSSVRGVTFFGHHASFGFFFLIPIAWLGAGPNVWDVLNAIALASCAPILYVIAKDRFGRAWISAAIGIIWLAQPSVQWWVQEGFHPECMAIPFLFATWLFGQRIAKKMRAGESIERRQWIWFWLSFVGAIMWKEDLALALVGMGLVWMIGRRWRLGIPVAVIAALWFGVFGAYMVPHVAGGTVYSGIYGSLGATPGEMVKNSVVHPSMILQRWGDNNAVGYSSGLNESFGYVTLFSPVTWLIGAPQWFANISSAAAFTWDPHFRYQSIPLAAMMISFIEGVWFLIKRRRWLGEAAVIVGLGAALWTGWAHGAGPWSPHNYRAGYWPLTVPSTQAGNEAALKLIRPDDGVSADYLMVPHLSHRQFLYTFPNPWKNSNYGVTPDAHGDPSKVDWIIMDTAMLQGDNAALYNSIKASGEFQVAMQQDGIEVLRRIRPPGKGTAPIDTG